MPSSGDLKASLDFSVDRPVSPSLNEDVPNLDRRDVPDLDRRDDGHGGQESSPTTSTRFWNTYAWTFEVALMVVGIIALPICISFYDPSHQRQTSYSSESSVCVYERVSSITYPEKTNFNLSATSKANAPSGCLSHMPSSILLPLSSSHRFWGSLPWSSLCTAFAELMIIRITSWHLVQLVGLSCAESWPSTKVA